MQSPLGWLYHKIMIHYTLLPDKETRSLKREYKTRLFIVLAFFVSCGIVVGMGSLVPAYLLSLSKEKEARNNIQVLQKGGQEKGTNSIFADLATTTKIIKKFQVDDGKVSFSQVIPEIIIHRSNQIFINSFKFSMSRNASSSLDTIIQGKALSREALIAFKKELENDARISKVELPVSDLAKSKDISFAIRFNIKQ